MTDVEIMKRAATIARNTRCWIGIGCVVARDEEVVIETYNETLPGEKFCQEFRDQRGGSDPAAVVRPDSPLVPSNVEGVRSPSLSRTKDGSEPSPGGCIRYELQLSQGREIDKACSIHAEALAIAKAAKSGIKIDGATMYVTSFPCLICLRAIIASGIKKVVYMNDFYKSHHLDLCKQNHVEIGQISEENVWR